MPAVSKKQQRFFGMVRAAQKGEMKNPSKEVSDVAGDISMKDAKKFAKTKHKGLPEKKVEKESFDIDKSAHRTAQKKAKLRNLAKGNMNPNEKSAAEKKATPDAVPAAVLEEVSAALDARCPGPPARSVLQRRSPVAAPGPHRCRWPAA